MAELVKPPAPRPRPATPPPPAGSAGAGANAANVAVIAKVAELFASKPPISANTGNVSAEAVKAAASEPAATTPPAARRGRPSPPAAASTAVTEPLPAVNTTAAVEPTDHSSLSLLEHIDAKVDASMKALVSTLDKRFAKVESSILAVLESTGTGILNNQAEAMREAGDALETLRNIIEDRTSGGGAPPSKSDCIVTRMVLEQLPATGEDAEWLDTFTERVSQKLCGGAHKHPRDPAEVEAIIRQHFAVSKVNDEGDEAVHADYWEGHE